MLIKLTIELDKEIQDNILFEPTLIQILALKNAVINGTPVLFNPVEEESENQFSLDIIHEEPLDESKVEDYQEAIAKTIKSYLSIAGVEHSIGWS